MSSRYWSAAIHVPLPPLPKFLLMLLADAYGDEEFFELVPIPVDYLSGISGIPKDEVLSLVRGVGMLGLIIVKGETYTLAPLLLGEERK